MRPIDADVLIEFCAERWIPLNIDAVNMQPTIQPEERTEKRTKMHACDLISRQALCEYALNQKDKSVTPNDIMRFPSVQPEPKEGEWEEIEVVEAYDIAGVKTWASKMMCNKCYFSTYAIEGHFGQYIFCPNCGSKNQITKITINK